VLQVTLLHLYVGQRWAYPDDTPDRAEVKGRMDELYERIRSVCHTLGYALVDGRTYQEPGTRP